MDAGTMFLWCFLIVVVFVWLLLDWDGPDDGAAA